MGTGLTQSAGRSGRRGALGRWLVALLCGVPLVTAIGNQSPAASPGVGDAGLAAVELLPPLAPVPAMAPEPRKDGGPHFELTLQWPNDDDLSGLLVRAGAAAREADAAALVVRKLYPDAVPGSSDVKLTLDLPGRPDNRIRRLAIFNDLGAVTFVRGRDGSLDLESGDTLRQHSIALDGEPYWALRRAGIDGAIGTEAVRLLPGAATNGTLRLVVSERPDRFTERARPRLLYLAWSNGSGERRWVRWDAEPDGWLEVGTPKQSGFARPVAGRLTSAYGLRHHPILGFARLHRGIDLAAPWGTPVRAAADGVVTLAGWRGGYGRQVYVAHSAAMATSYSHLSAVAVKPGIRIRRGQLLGYVGASGMATGPHLHFELYVAGRPVDPLRAGGVGTPASDPRVAALVERLTKAPSA